MKKILVSLVLAPALFAKSLVLDPAKDLSFEDLDFVANGGQVEFSKDAMGLVDSGFEVLKEAVIKGKSVYGLSVGVGWNKDKPVFVTEDSMESSKAGKKINNSKMAKKSLNPELIELSKNFNKISLRAHALGFRNPFAPWVVRAAMLIRLRSAVKGEAGISPELANIYKEFLNRGITPVVPSFGSVGEADITLGAHIGLAMMGEHEVFYKGEKVPSMQALQAEGLNVLEPVAKDFLSIISNNSLFTAYLIDQSRKAERILNQQMAIYVLMLEALNGNIAPFSSAALNARGFDFLSKSAKNLASCVEGSYLLKPHPKRALQDPLSFRTQVYAIAQAQLALIELKEALIVAMNHSDDNPLVIPSMLGQSSSMQSNSYKKSAQKPKTQESSNSWLMDSEVMQSYFVNDRQAIVPTANFEYLPLVARLESLNLALARLSENITQSILRLTNPDFTGLPRFLMHPDNKGHGFGAIEKPIVLLNEEIKNLSHPQSIKSISLAGNIEDIATFSNLSASNLAMILENLTYLQGFELLYGTQAIDLRLQEEKISLGKCSKALYEGYRKEVEFLKDDRVYSEELKKSYEFLKR